MNLTHDLCLRLGLSAVILYLGAHALSGRQGLVSYLDLQARARALEAEAADLDQEIGALQVRAARMRPASLDLDYLEEKARTLLNATRVDEVVLLETSTPSPSGT